jgi:hypothetical protein
MKDNRNKMSNRVFDFIFTIVIFYEIGTAGVNHRFTLVIFYEIDTAGVNHRFTLVENYINLGAENFQFLFGEFS